jgi:hypothetical protein
MDAARTFQVGEHVSFRRTYGWRVTGYTELAWLYNIEHHDGRQRQGHVSLLRRYRPGPATLAGWMLRELAR